MTDFDPTQNRVPTCLLTADELAALKAACEKHGAEIWTIAAWLDTPIHMMAEARVYRAKPAPRPTIMVNGIAVPEPVRTALTMGQQYFSPDPQREAWASTEIWDGGLNDYAWLQRGLIHLAKADAITHARAMCAPGMQEGVR